MIVIVDNQPGRISALKKRLRSDGLCTVADTAQQLRNLCSSNKIVAVIADAQHLDSLAGGWEALLLFNRSETKILLLSDRYSPPEVRSLAARHIYVLPADATPVQVEAVIHPSKEKRAAIALRAQKKNMSRLRDHLFSNLLEGHDLPQDTDAMMEFLGLSSPTHKYYLPFIFAYSPMESNATPSDWETALQMQDIACEEISKLAINRSCLRTPNHIAFVLLMEQPGDPFRYEFEAVLEIIERRIARECGHRISVGVGLADNSIHGLICGYQQACIALDHGAFFGKSFVSFYSDLWERDSQRFQFSKAVKEQITQHLYQNELAESDRLVEQQLRQFQALGLATRDNILALKIDLAVFLMDLSDKLSIVAEKPEFNTQLINSCLQSESVPELELIVKQYLREMVSTSQAAQDRRAGKIVRNTQAIIAEHICEPINVQLLAQWIHISPNYLSALFKAETAVRLTEYITNMKMQEAARMMRETDRNIIEIATAVGYNNANYFSRLFKKLYGMIPSEYRLMHNASTQK